MLPLVLALLGLLALAGAALRGDLTFGFFLIFPLILGVGPLAALGVVLLMAAAVAWVFSRARPSDVEWDAMPDSRHVPPELWAHEEPETRGERKVRHGGVALIGPFPIAWGSDRTMLVGALVTMAVLVALMLLVMLWLSLAR